VLFFHSAAQTPEKQGLNLFRQSVGVKIKGVNRLVPAFFNTPMPAFKMEAAMVTKHGCERALLLAGRTRFHPFRNFVATTVAKLGAWNDVSRAIWTEIHDWG